MKRSLVFLLFLFLSLLIGFLPNLALAASAKFQGFTANADDLFRDNDNDFAELKGNVKIEYQGQQILCDRALIYLKSKKALFEGNVHITYQDVEIFGNQVLIDYDGETGMIYDGFVKSGNITFQGQEIQRLNSKEFYVIDANYSTCTNCPYTWSFEGQQIRAQLGGYAYLKNSFLKLGGFPIFWFPYLVVPINSERESGILPPSFDHFDDTGGIFTLSYFWAINRSTDATFTLKNYELAGQKLLTEYRYVLDNNSSGAIRGGFIDDRVFAKESRVNTYRSLDRKYEAITRWFVKYDHYYDLGDDVIQRANILTTRDLQYSKDFPKETLDHGDPAHENRISLTKNTYDKHFSIDSSYYINLLKADPLAANDDAVHRLPEIHFSQLNKKLGDHFLFNLDFNYTNFYRGSRYHDSISTVKGNKFVTNDMDDPGCEHDLKPCNPTILDYDPSKDVIRTGQRFDIQPSISTRIGLTDWLDVLPRVSYRETQYMFSVGDDRQNARRFVRTEVTGRTKLYKVYGDQTIERNDLYKHEIIPEITYTLIPWREQKSHPFFGAGQTTEAPFSSRDNISDVDLNNGYGFQFDYNDRIYDRNLITFSLLNKIIKKAWSGDSASYGKIASLRVYQSYDFYQESLNDPNKEPMSELGVILQFDLPHVSTYSQFKYYPSQQVTDINSNFKLYNDAGQFMKLGLTKKYTISPGSPVDSSTRIEDLSFAAGFTSGYINLMGGMVYNLNWFNSNSDTKIKRITWITQIKPPGECWVLNFYRDQEIGGKPGWHFDYQFNFDGKPQPPLPPEALSEYGY